MFCTVGKKASTPLDACTTKITDGAGDGSGNTQLPEGTDDKPFKVDPSEGLVLQVREQDCDKCSIYITVLLRFTLSNYFDCRLGVVCFSSVFGSSGIISTVHV
jgi:hypothetical protein